MVINCSAVIGDNVDLYQFSTIGSMYLHAAHIGNEVYIGPSVCIVENVTIGDGVTIGAGAVVADNVPDHALMLGVPAKLAGYVCECGARMKFENDRAVCAACGRTYLKSPDGNVEEA